MSCWQIMRTVTRKEAEYGWSCLQDFRGCLAVLTGSILIAVLLVHHALTSAEYDTW